MNWPRGSYVGEIVTEPLLMMRKSLHFTDNEIPKK